MPTYLIKPLAGDDFYLVWDTDTSRPVAHGTAGELKGARPDVATEAALASADERGTSAPELEGGFADFAYGQEVFTLASDAGIRLVARTDLRAHVESES